MATPRTHIKDPTYTLEEVAEALDMEPRHVTKACPAPEYSWPTFARLIVARKIHKALPPSMKTSRVNTWPALVKMIMDGPVPRKGRVVVRNDGTVYYIAGTMSTTTPNGISIIWDGTLKV